MIRGMGYECCGIKNRHLSNKMKQTPKLFLNGGGKKSLRFSTVIHNCVTKSHRCLKKQGALDRLARCKNIWIIVYISDGL